MAYKSGFFNSINGDRKYTAEELSNFYGQLISNGVLNKKDNGLQVTAGNGLTVQISKGWAWINTHYFYNDSPITLTIPTVGANTKTFNVILRLNNTQQVDGRYIKPLIIEGDIIREDLIYDIVLAKVTVNANATSVSNANIVDTRPNTDLCGWVTGLITQANTTELDNQWRSAYQNFYNKFTSWFNVLTDALGIITYNQKYEVDAISTEGQGSFKPNIKEYDFTSGDIIEVYINGFRLIKDIEYTISGNGSNLNISFKNSLNAGNSISVVVIKSNLGTYPDGVSTAGGGVTVSNFADNNSVVTNYDANYDDQIDTFIGTYEEAQ